MIALVSPAKSLDFDSIAQISESSELMFPEDVNYLVAKLRKKSPRQLKGMMDISDNLAELNALRYHSWAEDFKIPQSKQAVFAFNGDVYHGLNISSFSTEDLSFGQSHLRILSGLYGILRPLDLIQPYRLEMGTSWHVTPKKTSLYKYWGKRLTNQLEKEIKATNSEFILNLASQEYAKVIQFNSLSIPTISPEFREEKGDRFQMISFFAKKARGLMAQYAIKNKIQYPEDLLKFKSEGYHFNESLSNMEKNKWVFTRKSEQ